MRTDLVSVPPELLDEPVYDFHLLLMKLGDGVVKGLVILLQVANHVLSTPKKRGIINGR